MPMKMSYFKPKFCFGKNMVYTRKLNGFGFIWTGQRFLSLNYKPFNAPQVICDILNPVPFQGEFWKEDSLSKVSSTVTKNEPNVEDWKTIYIVPHVVFPHSLIPVEYRKDNVDSLDFTFEQSLNYLRSTYGNLLLFQEPKLFCGQFTSVSDIERRYKECLKIIKANRWEGIVVQNLDSTYEDESEFPRSKNTLKIKPDSETTCAVFNHVAGKTGRKIGKTGSLLCIKTWDDEVLSFPNGNENMVGKTVLFKVSGLTDEECSLVNIYFPKFKKINVTFKYLSDDGLPQNCNIRRDV